MQPPQKMQPARSGPCPPKYGSGTTLPGSPKKTATSVAWNVAPFPVSSAHSFITRSAAVNRGLTAAPSIRFAVS